jgi:hypothetical protein
MSMSNLTMGSKPTALVQDPPRVKPHQLMEVLREMPTIILGLYKMAEKYRWRLAVLACFNIVIATWAVVQPLVISWSVDTFVANAPYAEIVAIIIFPTLAIVIPNGTIFPFFRGLYTLKYVSLPFKKHVSMLCFTLRRRSHKMLSIKAKGPVVQEGREAAWDVIEFFTREPFFVLKGVVIAGILLWKSPLLASLVTVGIVADVAITLLMRKRLILPLAHMQTNEQDLKGLENQGHDQDPDEVSDEEFEASWDIYIKNTLRAEIPRMIYQILWRGGVSHIVRIATMLLAGWWVHMGWESIGSYLFLISLAASASDPFEIFLSFIWKSVELREKLRRLGIVYGIDLGLKSPLTAA